MEGNDKVTPPPQLSKDYQTIELPAKALAPFGQSSLTVRRSSSASNELAVETSQTGIQLDSTIQTPVNKINLDKIFLFDCSPRQHLGNDHCQKVDKHLGLRKSLTVSRHPDGVRLNGGKARPREVLPKPSELLSRSRKRTHRAATTMPKAAMTVEEHVTQLQRKKASFYGGKQETMKPFIPHESHVHVTREQLQQVPNSEDVMKPLSPHPSFWSSDDWLSTPYNESATTSYGHLQNNFQDTSVTMSSREFPLTSVNSMGPNHLHQSNNEDNQYTFWGLKLLYREAYSEE